MAMPMPTPRLFFARSYMPAPIFWAAKALTEELMATAGRIAKELNLPTTPTAADAVAPPMLFTSAVITRKEMFTMMLCTEDGIPRPTISFIFSVWMRKDRSLKSKMKRLRLKYRAARIRLTACAITVAQAAPAAPIPRPFTSHKSNTTFTRQAIPTKMRGRMESPKPRWMEEMAL